MIGKFYKYNWSWSNSYLYCTEVSGRTALGPILFSGDSEPQEGHAMNLDDPEVIEATPPEFVIQKFKEAGYIKPSELKPSKLKKVWGYFFG